MGQSVIDFCRSCFDTHSMHEIMNETLLYLIPKCPRATMLKNFSSIGLCNTIYKTITKVIVNRIKPLIPDIIDPTQASFLSNMRASDNAIIVQEYILTWAR